jgi:hypothetical protein
MEISVVELGSWCISIFQLTTQAGAVCAEAPRKCSVLSTLRKSATRPMMLLSRSGEQSCWQLSAAHRVIGLKLENGVCLGRLASSGL